MKIGIPNALLTSYYISFIKPFFETLGQDIVISPKTSKEVFDKGARVMVPEMCAPVKIMAGHVIYLLNSDADYIYIPRFLTIEDGEAFCPKFMSLPDMLVSVIPDLEDKILTHDILSASDNIATMKNFLNIGLKFSKDKRKIKNAIKTGENKWLDFRKLCIEEKYNCYSANNKILKYIEDKKFSSNIKIGVVGYVYNIYDNLISMDILNRLKELKVETVTFETIDNNTVFDKTKRFDKKMFWSFSNKTIASAYKFFEDESIDGIIHVTAFGCGPDSIVGKYLELDSEEYEKPFMTLRVDEHTGENHLQTRLEAFVDMIYKLKQEKELALC